MRSPELTIKFYLRQGTTTSQSAFESQISEIKLRVVLQLKQEKKPHNNHAFQFCLMSFVLERLLRCSVRTRFLRLHTSRQKNNILDVHVLSIPNRNNTPLTHELKINTEYHSNVYMTYCVRLVGRCACLFYNVFDRHWMYGKSCVRVMTIFFEP